MGNQPSDLARQDLTIDVIIDEGAPGRHGAPDEGGPDGTVAMLLKVDPEHDSHGGSINSLAVSPNLQYLASGERYGLRIWDLSTAEELATFSTTAKEGSVTAVRFTEDGTHLVASCKNSIVVCNVNKMDAPTRYRDYVAPIATFALSPDQHTRKMITLCYSDLVHIHDFGAGGFCSTLAKAQSAPPQKSDESHRAFTFDSVAQAAQFSPDSKYVAFGLSTGQIRAFTTGSNKELGKFTPHRQAVLAIDIAWGGVERQLMIASGGGDCCVRVHTLLTSTLQFELDGHTRCVSSVAFSADGLMLASAGHDGSIAMWSMVTGVQLWLFLGHSAPVNTILFVPAIEEYMITGSDDKSIRLWNIQTGQQKGVY